MINTDLFERIKTIKARVVGKNSIKAETEMLDSQHRIKVIIIADKKNLKILDIKARMAKVPYKICLKTAPKITNLKGVKEVIGGPEGCTHLIDLIMDTARGIFQISLKIDTQGLKPVKQREILMERLKASCLGYKA